MKGTLTQIIIYIFIFTADVLSAVSFSPDGEFLATGDKGGRIVVFQQKAGKTTAGKGGSQLAEYGFYSEFQSHEPEFDYLKSLEIEEKINSIRWCRNKGNGLHLISTNDKTIKLWRIYERRNWTISENNLLNNANDDEKGSWNTRSPQIVTRLKVPKVTKLASSTRT